MCQLMEAMRVKERAAATLKQTHTFSQFCKQTLVLL